MPSACNFLEVFQFKSQGLLMFLPLTGPLINLGHPLNLPAQERGQAVQMVAEQQGELSTVAITGCGILLQRAMVMIFVMALAAAVRKIVTSGF
jgi:hypothetical protein